jgi:hypothetical protein
MSAGRIILLVFGIICVIVSLGLFVTGGFALMFDNAFRDYDGYYSTGPISIGVDAAAVTTEPANINIEGYRGDRALPVTLKIEAESTTDEPIFIGIARTSSVDAYLEDISYAEARGFTGYPDDIYYSLHQGDDSAPAPADQSFWVASASGSAVQTIEWRPSNGNYTMVLMNADGTSPVAADVTLAARIPAVIKAIGIGLLVGGAIFLIGGAIMLFFAAKGW